MERQLTECRPFGVLLRYALPVLGGNLFQLFYTLADTVIVGKTLGADALRRASSPVRGATACRKSLAEFAPAGANKVLTIFSGDMRVGENTSRLANVRT